MKNLLITILFLLTFIQPSFGAGSSGDNDKPKTTDYEKAVKFS